MEERISNDLSTIIAQAFEQMKKRNPCFSPDRVNLAELSRLTGLSRQRLRRLKRLGFRDEPIRRPKTEPSVLEGFTATLDELLRSGVTNSTVCLERLRGKGYPGSLSTVKRYLSAHRDLVPAQRRLVDPQGSRGTRYQAQPGESFQMDWGFTNVVTPEGDEFRAACFAMICHHCGKRYVEFFPNARQENLFIGMIHAFTYMGIPKSVRTDNMKSVVIRRDSGGRPVWQKDYESFMNTLAFETRLCKPRHPFTKGKVERLIRFVKDNFLVGRVFWNFNDLNEACLKWCDDRNSTYHREIDDIPEKLHSQRCMRTARPFEEDPEILPCLCPLRRISFDGFVNYEGRRFGVPFRFSGKEVRVCRTDGTIRIFTPDLKEVLTTHDVTWSRRDSFCPDQFHDIEQPEELPTAPVRTRIEMQRHSPVSIGFGKFDFEEDFNE